MLCDRRPEEDSDSDFRDSSSDGSSDCEPERNLKFTSEQHSKHSVSNDVSQRSDRLSSRDLPVPIQEDVSSDEGEHLNPQACLIFEYFERDSPYGREPLADKVRSGHLTYFPLLGLGRELKPRLILIVLSLQILDIAFRVPELKTLRSCDILSSSWFSVAW